MGLFENTDKLPNKLENNYIYEAIIELRYQPTVSVELMTVKLDDALGSEYSRPVKVLDVPDFVKQSVPEYNNTICYIIRNVHNFFSIGIGAGLISLRITNFSYGTWKVFIDEFKKIYEKIHSYIDKKEQIGVRYINVFDGNVLPKLNLDINISAESILDKPLVLSWQVENNDRIIKASVTSVATVNYTNFKSGQNETKNNVSIFDIDCVYRNINGINKDIFEEIETNHNLIKRYFFGVCKKDFVNDELKPIDGE